MREWGILALCLAALAGPACLASAGSAEAVASIGASTRGRRLFTVTGNALTTTLTPEEQEKAEADYAAKQKAKYEAKQKARVSPKPTPKFKKPTKKIAGANDKKKEAAALRDIISKAPKGTVKRSPQVSHKGWSCRRVVLQKGWSCRRGAACETREPTLYPTPLPLQLLKPKPTNPDQFHPEVAPHGNRTSWNFNVPAGVQKTKRPGIGGGTPATLACPGLACLADLDHLFVSSLSIPIELPGGKTVDLAQVGRGEPATRASCASCAAPPLPPAAALPRPPAHPPRCPRRRCCCCRCCC